jgi:catechol 2,3-dioxygenase-like lactoylglutathione lyase family enzyme
MAFVADMDQAAGFYRDTLGLPVQFASPYWTEFATGETTLVLHPASSEHPAGSFGLGLRVADLTTFCSDMAAHEVPCTQPPTMQFGATLARFLDVNGAEFTVGADPAAASQ